MEIKEKDTRSIKDIKDLSVEYPFGDKPFGNLLVLRYSHSDKSKHYFFCKCLKCGKVIEKPIRFDNIKIYGRTSFCDCKIEKPRPTESLVGSKFGYLEVKEFAGKAKNGQSLWKCLCTKCNENYTITSRSNLMKKNNPVTMCRKCAERGMSERQTVDLTDNTIGNIKVLYRNKEKEDTKDYRVTIWRCKCLICGEEFDSVASKLVGEDHITCCPNCREDWRTTHNMTHTEFYSVWGNIKQRCYNPNNPNYINYGARGITLCDFWKDDFINFYNDMYDSYCKYKELHPGEYVSIDRIDNNKGYYKDNCRWADYVIQQNNKRTNARYNYNGKNYTVPEIITTGIPDSDRNYNSIKSSIYKGKDIKDAILSPERKNVVNPVSFYDDKGNRIQDPYNNRHDDLHE